MALQVIVGAVTTGVAAGSKNVTPFHPLTPNSRSFDTLISRSGLLLLYWVVFLPGWLLILQKSGDPENLNLPNFDRGS